MAAISENEDSGGKLYLPSASESGLLAILFPCLIYGGSKALCKRRSLVSSSSDSFGFSLNSGDCRLD